MSRRRLLLIVVALVLANLVHQPTAVRASCAVAPQLATAITDAPAVFVGIVTAVNHAGRVAVVRVQDVWKGRVAANVQILGTPDLNAGATSVDRYYTVGEKYLFIPVAGSGDRFRDNNCTLTQGYSTGLAGFRPSDAVGPPPADRPSAVTAPPPADGSSWPLFAAGGGLIALMVAMLLGIARWRQHAPRLGGP